MAAIAAMKEHGSYEQVARIAAGLVPEATPTIGVEWVRTGYKPPSWITFISGPLAALGGYVYKHASPLSLLLCVVVYSNVWGMAFGIGFLAMSGVYVGLVALLVLLALTTGEMLTNLGHPERLTLAGGILGGTLWRKGK